MRNARLRSVLAISLAALLIGCSTGMKDTTRKPAPGDSLQRSSRVLKKKKPASSAAATSKAPVKTQ